MKICRQFQHKKWKKRHDTYPCRTTRNEQKNKQIKKKKIIKKTTYKQTYKKKTKIMQIPTIT